MTSNQSHWLRYFFPRLQDVLFVSLLAGIILYGPRLFNQDGDLGRHITIGRYILERGVIPLHDVFSHSMEGSPLVPHEWLSQVLFAFAYKLMGLDGVVILTGLVISSTFVLTYLETLRRGTFRLVALAVVLMGAAASSLHWLSRPHIFTFLLLAIWTFQLEKSLTRQNGSIFLFPIIMLIWVNTHGAFIAGFVILGVFLVEWVLKYRHEKTLGGIGKRLGLIAISSFLTTFINPAGWQLWTTSLGFIGNNYLVNHTVEYLPPDFHNPITWPFLFILGLALLALAWRRQIHLRDGMLLAIWSIMSLYSARNIPLFAIVTVPIMGELLRARAREFPWLVRLEIELAKIEVQLRGIFWPSLVILSLLLLFSRHPTLDLRQQGNSFDPSVFPIQAVDWLDRNPQDGNVFNYFIWGGYLLFREWPEQRVFIDGQTDFYGEALTREYEAIISVSPNWQQILNKYEISWAIIPVNSNLSRVLKEAGWKTLYEDSTAIILRKP